MYSWEDLRVYKYTAQTDHKVVQFVLAFSLTQADVFMDVCCGDSRLYEVDREDMRRWWRYKLYHLYPHYIRPGSWPDNIKRRYAVC